MTGSLSCKTIPQLYEYITEVYGKKTDKFYMFRKVNDKFEGIKYSELKDETEKFAFGLSALGLKKDDKVAIISENRPEWVYADMAILGLGAVDVPVYPSLTAESIEFILSNSESKGVIVSNKFQLNKILKVKNKLKNLQFTILLNEKDIIQNEPSLFTYKDVQEMGNIYKNNHPQHFSETKKHVNENDVCTIIYTSGTTGEPKGVMLTHKNILSNVHAALESFPINENDVFLSFLPLCHIFERMAGYYTGFAAGSSIYFAESIESVAQNLIEAKPTIITTVPRLFERMYSKVIKNVESQKPVKQKIFYWAANAGRKYIAAKQKGKISPVLIAQQKIADTLVFKKIREKTGGKLRFFISGRCCTF